MKTAWIFPGQGSQHIGMGKAIYDAFPEAREVMQEVDDALSQPLSRLMFEGDEAELTLTANTQPALMAVSLALVRVIEAQSGKKASDLAQYVAGHSLGEYSALAAANTFSIADTARLLRTRGNAMQAAVPEGQGAMAAVIGLSIEEVQKLVQEAEGDGTLEIANDNAPGQVVVSGTKAAIERAEPLAKAAGAKRYLVLNVSAPFHSSLIHTAAAEMQEALAATSMHNPQVPLIANVIAEPVTESDSIRELLVQQVTGQVRWRESVLKAEELGVTHMVEIGAGKVLSGLNRRIAPSQTCLSIQGPDDIESYLQSIT